jgi:hypothetical protein
MDEEFVKRIEEEQEVPEESEKANSEEPEEEGEGELDEREMFAPLPDDF